MVQHLVSDQRTKELVGIDAGEHGHQVAVESALTERQPVGTVPPVREPTNHMLHGNVR